MSSNEDAVNQLGSWMKQELEANEHKGNWEDFKDVKSIISEINYHHQKGVNLLTDPSNIDLNKLKENIADTCNCYLFLANATNLISNNMRKLTDLNDNELKALDFVHNALYFNDSSDYRTALFEAMCALIGIEKENDASDFPSSKNFERILKEKEKRGL